MATKLLNLSGSQEQTTSSTNPEDYILEGDIEKYAVDMMERASEFEYWSPTYQACEPLLMKYLQTGSVPDLTRAYLMTLYEKVDTIPVPKNPYTQFYCDIYALINNTRGEIFKGLMHDNIVDFCNTIVTFFNTQKRVIWRDMHSNAVMHEVMEGLLAKDTYRSLMCAVMLFRNQRAKGFLYEENYEREIRARLDKWIADYTKEFEKIYGMLGKQNEFYIWYRPTVLSCVRRGYDLCLKERGLVFLTPDVSKSEPQLVCQAINSYMNGGPLGTRPLNDRQSYAFDALYKIFFDNKMDDPDNFEGCSHALCIGRSSFDTFQNYLHAFYGFVERRELGQMLLDRIIAMENNENAPLTSEEYEASLRFRGFPLE